MGTRCTRGVSVFLCLYFLCIALRNIPQMDVSFCNLFSSLKKRHNCVCVCFFSCFFFLCFLFFSFKARYIEDPAPESKGWKMAVFSRGAHARACLWSSGLLTRKLC